MENLFLKTGWSTLGPLDLIDPSWKPAKFSFEYWMFQALKLAQSCAGRASPNPTVGCVFVKHNKIVSEGVTESYGGRHAERVAIESCSDKSCLKGSDCYVTLEPCAHYGKQPPCVEAIIAVKPSRVFCAISDPFDKVSGRGIQALREAGIEVNVGVLALESILWHLPFLFANLKKRPLVVAKWAQTANGMFADQKAKSKWISGTTSRRLTHLARQNYDAIAVGIGTFLVDEPQLNVREHLYPVGRQPVRVLIDPKGSLNEVDTKILKSSKVSSIKSPLIYLGPSVVSKKIKDKLAILAPDHRAVAANENLISLGRELESSFEELTTKPLQSIFVEGGAHTLSHLLDRNQIDYIQRFEAFSFVRQSSYQIFSRCGPVNMSEKLDFHLSALNRIDGDILSEACSREVLALIQSIIGSTNRFIKHV